MEEKCHRKEMSSVNNTDQKDDTSGHQVSRKSDEVAGVLKLSDVGSYSYCSLCAMSLLQLFEDKWHRDFKVSTLKKLLKQHGLSAQAVDSVKAVMDGQGFDDPKPYVDVILEEPVLEKCGRPVLTDLVSVAISDGCYDARMRVLIKHISWQLRVSWEDLEEVECTMASTLDSKQKEYTMSEEEKNEKLKKSKKAKAKRIAWISLATIGGGTLIGLTGGLAAPLVAAGAGAIIGGAGAAALGSAAGVAIIGSLFGVAGAGLTGYKMKKRVGAIEEFEFEPLFLGTRLQLQVQDQPAKQLHVTIAVTGWLSPGSPDHKTPWYSLAESREQYSLRWESKYLLQLGKAMDYILSGAMSVATQEALKYTILSSIISAIAWPAALVSAASVIDNPWSVCVQRATAAGKELAEVLLTREQGKRPVTLAGFSLGARVIFSCLEELSKRKGSEGIIEDVILLGAPVSGEAKHWESMSRVVAGKIINGYSKADWLLKFLFRTASVHLSTIAGLQPVKWDNRRMHNIDLTEVVTGHKDYMKKLDVVLKVVGVRTKDDVSVCKPKTSKPISRKTSSDSFTSSASEGEVFDDCSEGKVSPEKEIFSKPEKPQRSSSEEFGDKESSSNKSVEEKSSSASKVESSNNNKVSDEKLSSESIAPISGGKLVDDNTERLPSESIELVSGEKLVDDNTEGLPSESIELVSGEKLADDNTEGLPSESIEFVSGEKLADDNTERLPSESIELVSGEKLADDNTERLPSESIELVSGEKLADDNTERLPSESIELVSGEKLADDNTERLPSESIELVSGEKLADDNTERLPSESIELVSGEKLADDNTERLPSESIELVSGEKLGDDKSEQFTAESKEPVSNEKLGEDSFERLSSFSNEPVNGEKLDYIDDDNFERLPSEFNESAGNCGDSDDDSSIEIISFEGSLNPVCDGQEDQINDQSS